MKKITKIGVNETLIQKKKLKVAAYCRVSTASDEQLISLEAQKAHYENYIRSNDEWEYVGLYYDEGITGTKKDVRAGLLSMITDCEDGKIEFIITKSISRFARNTTDCLEMVRKLTDLGISIYFEKENINTGSMESELMHCPASCTVPNAGTSTAGLYGITEESDLSCGAAAPGWNMVLEPAMPMLSMNQNYKTLWFELLTWHLVKRIPCTMSCSEM